MYDENNPLNGGGAQLGDHRGHGVRDPETYPGVSRLVDREVVCAGGEEGHLRVEGAVIEQGVEGEGEEGREAIKEFGGFGVGEGGARFGRGGGHPGDRSFIVPWLLGAEGCRRKVRDSPQPPQ